MKKLILIALIALYGNLFAQTPDFIRTKKVNDQNVSDARLKAYLSFNLPHFPTFTLNGAKDSVGYMMYNTSINKAGIYKGSGQWDTLGVSIGGGGSYLPLAGGTLTGDLIRYNGFGNPDVAILSPNLLDISNSTTSRISRTYANKMQYVQGGSLTLDLTPATLTANRTITYPNASGTIALTAELSSYLPLSGGTLTGDLLISKTQPNLILSSTNPGPPGRAMSFYTTGTATNMMVDSTAVFSISGQSKTNILAASGAGAIPYLTLRSYTSGGATLSTPLRIERPSTSADGYLKYTTANSIKWLVGGNSGSENYTIKNSALGTNALSVNIANNNISLSGALNFSSLANGILIADGSGNITTTGFSSGTYTPTVLASADAGSITVRRTHYSRVGDEVTITGTVSFDVTSIGSGYILLTLPPAALSTFDSIYDVRGVTTILSNGVTAPNTLAKGIFAEYDPGSALYLNWYAPGAESGLSLSFHAMYTVK